MHEENLRQLRRVVLAAPAERFHMRSFAEVAPCGTAFCALGWFALDPWARKNTGVVACLTAERDIFGRAAGLFGIGLVDARRLFGCGLSQESGAHSVAKDEVLWNIDELLAGRAARWYAATGYVGPYAADVSAEDEEDEEDGDDSDGFGLAVLASDEVAARLVADPQFVPEDDD